MRFARATLCFLLCATALSGCDAWNDDSQYDYAVFSDDGAGVAAVYMEFESKDTVTHLKKRNFQTQVVMKESLGAATPAALTTLLPGRVIDLFFMRSEGYIILGRETGLVDMPDGSQQADIHYDLVSMNGTVTSLGSGTFLTMLSCDGGTSKTAVSRPLRVIPSPNGQLLARFEADTTCDERIQTVTLLDPHDLSVVDGPYDIPEAAPSNSAFGQLWPTLDIGWTESGAFAASYWGSGQTFATVKATLFRPGKTPQKDVTMTTDCFYPPTTSSDVSDGNLFAEIHEETGTLSYSSTINGGAPAASDVFGCN